MSVSYRQGLGLKSLMLIHAPQFLSSIFQKIIQQLFTQNICICCSLLLKKTTNPKISATGKKKKQPKPKVICIKLKRNFCPFINVWQLSRHHSPRAMSLPVLPVSCLTEALTSSVPPSQLCLHIGLEKQFVTCTKNK